MAGDLLSSVLFLSRTLTPPDSVVPSIVNRTAQDFLIVSAHGLLKLLATPLAPLSNIQRLSRRRHIRSDSRPSFSLWREIAVRTPTDTRRLTHAQPSTIVVRKSLKRTAQQPRGPTSFADLPFAVHQ